MHKQAFLGFMLILFPALTFAAGSAILESNGEKMEIQWLNSDTVRLGEVNAKEYSLLKNGKAYSVFYDNGQPQVIELGAMLQAMGQMAQQMADEYPDFGEVITTKATGKTETHAGVKGEVFLITAKQANGETETVEAVLSDNVTAKEMTDAFLSTVSLIAGSENTKRFTQQLPKGKTGLLRSGNDFVVTQLSSSAPAKARFDLPAEPQDMGKMMQGLSQQMQGLGDLLQQQMQQMQNTSQNR